MISPYLYSIVTIRNESNEMVVIIMSLLVQRSYLKALTGASNVKNMNERFSHLPTHPKHSPSVLSQEYFSLSESESIKLTCAPRDLRGAYS